MKRRSLLFLAVAWLYSTIAFAESFTITDIRIEGLQRISAGAIFAALPMRVGDTVDESELRSAVRALFRTGNFDDVLIGRDGSVLVIGLQERPSINEINIDGNKAIETEALLEGLRGAGLAQGEIFQRSTLDGMRMELRRQYVAQGRYDASIDTEIIQQPRNRVDVNINIDEGTVASIKHINIVGNEAFEEEDLLDLFELHATGFWSFISGDDKYAREKLKGDLETLESYYMDRGYIGFTIDSTQVSVSPAKDSVYITINVTEDVKHTVRDVSLAGDIVLDEAYLKPYLVVRKGDYFNQALVTQIEEFLGRRLGNEGYTFAKVRGIPEVDDETKEVDIEFFIDPGKRTYVRRINFRGNTKTVDEVLRREMRQMEGAPANSAIIEHSKIRLERLGFFKEVEVETQEVPGTDDLVDVEYTVEEQHSGSIGASIGYSQGTGMIIGANVQQNNFLGTGQKVGFSINRSNYQSSYSLNYTDPYFTEDGVSRGFNLFYRATDYDEINVSSFSRDTYGAGVNFGYPISEIERLGFSATYTNTHIEVGQFAVQEIKKTPFDFADDDLFTHYFVEPRILPELDENGFVVLDDEGNVVDPGSNGVLAPVSELPLDALDNTNPAGFIDLNGDTFNQLSFTASWRRSTLNRGLLATRGSSNTVVLELSAPGSELEFYKLIYRGEFLFPINNIFTARFRTELGYGDGFGGTKNLPFFENFYAGGFGSVRGFKDNTLGPRSTPPRRYITECAIQEIVDSGENKIVTQQIDECGDPDNFGFIADADGKLVVENVFSNPDPFGGNVLIETSTELLFALPFIKDQRSVRTGLFFDAGNVFNTNCGPSQINCFDIDMDEMRYSVGVGVTWITAMGPLTFSLAKALNEGPDDEREVFQFSIGRGF